MLIEYFFLILKLESKLRPPPPVTKLDPVAKQAMIKRFN